MKRCDYGVSAGIGMYEAIALIIWYDILTEEFILYLNNYLQTEQVTLKDPTVNEHLFDIFTHTMWMKSTPRGYLENNGKCIDWEYDDTKMISVKISKLIGNTKIPLLEIK